MIYFRTVFDLTNDIIGCKDFILSKICEQTIQNPVLYSPLPSQVIYLPHNSQ